MITSLTTIVIAIAALAGTGAVAVTPPMALNAGRASFDDGGTTYDMSPSYQIAPFDAADDVPDSGAFAAAIDWQAEKTKDRRPVAVGGLRDVQDPAATKAFDIARERLQDDPRALEELVAKFRKGGDREERDETLLREAKIVLANVGGPEADKAFEFALVRAKEGDLDALRRFIREYRRDWKFPGKNPFPVDPGHPGAGGTVGAVPEPAMWAMMVVGFGLVGTAVRRRAGTTVAA